MTKRFLDTSTAIASGPTGTSNLGYDPVVTSYTREEMVHHEIDVSSTITVYSPTWSDFQCVVSGDWGKFYQWADSTSGQTLQIYHYAKPLGKKTPCGDSATVQIFYGDQVFYCCESVASKDADFSTVIGTILYPEIEVVDARDKCLGQTCKFIHFAVVSNYRYNSSL